MRRYFCDKCEQEIPLEPRLVVAFQMPDKPTKKSKNSIPSFFGFNQSPEKEFILCSTCFVNLYNLMGCGIAHTPSLT